MYDLTYMRNLKTKQKQMKNYLQKNNSDLWSPEVVGRGCENWMKVIKMYKLYIIN